MRLLLLYLSVLAFLSLNPWIMPASSPAIGNLAWDKVDHAIAYGFLSMLLMWMFRYHRKVWLRSLKVLCISSSLGVLLEFCQYWFTATRHFSYEDAGANVFGAALGVSLFCGYLLLMFKPGNSATNR